MLEIFSGLFKIETEYTTRYVMDLKEYSSLPRKTRKTLEMLWKYQLPSAVITRLKKKFPFNHMQDKDIETCVDEFKKFMAIMVIGKTKKQGVAMTSNVIDEIWHQFLLFTIEYQKFSEMLNGKYIHHTPNTASFSFGPDAAQFFFTTYRQYFGVIHPIWNYTIIEDKSEVYGTGSAKLVPILHSNMGEAEIEGSALTSITKYQLGKKEMAKSPIGGKSMGSIEGKPSGSGGCGGFACGGYATGYTAADGSGVSDLGGCGGGGDGGGCGGCGGCGG